MDFLRERDLGARNEALNTHVRVHVSIGMWKLKEQQYPKTAH